MLGNNTETMERKGVKPRISFSDPRPGDQKVFICDIRKAKNQLGWEPRVNVEEGIERLLRWIKDNLDSIRSAFGTS